MNNKLIFNADDVGISPGCNHAVEKLCRNGVINSVSLMMGGDYINDAIDKIVKVFPEIKYGVHLDLTYGKSLKRSKFLCKDGLFCNSYGAILIKTILKKSFREEIREELEAQVSMAEELGITISHLDSHRHVHMIPPIYKIVKQIAEDHNIERIRFSCDDLRFTIANSVKIGNISIPGIIKYIVLRMLSLFCRKSGSTKFFSVIHSGTVSHEMVQRIINNSSGEQIEVMLHPGLPEIDSNTKFRKKEEGRYWRSNARVNEFNSCISVSDKSEPFIFFDSQETPLFIPARMALFVMFYGLYGSYWSSVLAENRPPVIMDVLRQLGYQFLLCTSAKFTYPEFDQTIFYNVPKENMHQSGRGGFKNDRENVSRIINFIKNRNRKKTGKV